MMSGSTATARAGFGRICQRAVLAVQIIDHHGSQLPESRGCEVAWIEHVHAQSCPETLVEGFRRTVAGRKSKHLGLCVDQSDLCLGKLTGFDGDSACFP